MQHQTPDKRLVSLDAFRGLAIAAMILVNNPGTYGAVYAELVHAEWNGWTIADCVFPFFLFMVGVSMVFSFGRRSERGDLRKDIERQVLRRTVILFCLGLLLNTFPIFHLSTIRIPGVLQRIALCYFFTAVIALKTGIRTQIGWLAGLLLAYWLMMELIPVPGIGAGVYEPGRNFAAYVDSILLDGHMWSHYESWDPEGIVSTIPAVATTLLGVLTGHWLRSGYPGEKKAALMLVAGPMLLVSGKILDIWLPINKNIWTSSYSIFMTGWAVTVFAVFYWLIDIKGLKRWATPMVIFGMNSIAIYLLSEAFDTSLRFMRFTDRHGAEISARDYIFRYLFLPLASPVNASLFYAIAYVLLMFLVAWTMWKKRWFVRI